MQKISLQTLERPFAFTSPFGGERFALLLRVSAKDVSEEEQAALSKAFVDQGCRYASCVGYKCSSWDDSIDEGAVEEFLDESEIPDDRFVLTSSHPDESLTPVLKEFRGATFNDGSKPTNFLVLLLGANPAVEEEAREGIERLFGQKV